MLQGCRATLLKLRVSHLHCLARQGKCCRLPDLVQRRATRECRCYTTPCGATLRLHPKRASTPSVTQSLPISSSLHFLHPCPERTHSRLFPTLDPSASPPPICLLAPLPCALSARLQAGPKPLCPLLVPPPPPAPLGFLTCHSPHCQSACHLEQINEKQSRIPLATQLLLN